MTITDEDGSKKEIDFYVPKINDIVIVEGREDGKKFDNEKGRVIKINKFAISIEFFKNIEGHSCDGLGKLEHCWSFFFPTTPSISIKKFIKNSQLELFGETK